jgi:hypothetical protein
VEPSHDVFHCLDERTPGVSELNKVVVPAKDCEAKFRLDFTYLPAD